MTESFLTFEQLFEAYKSNYSNSRMTQQQNENLRVWHERLGRRGITLSQSDAWMMKAGVIKKKVLSVTDTGVNFAKFKQFSLTENQFEEYLEALADAKHLDARDMKTKLLSAGLPSNEQEDVS